MACGQFRFFFLAQGCGRRFPMPRPCYKRGRSNTIPSISPIRTQARGRFAQVIHMVVHSKSRQEVLLPGWQAAAYQWAGAYVVQPARAQASTWPEPG